jgi:chemotaxis protein MotB
MSGQPVDATQEGEGYLVSVSDLMVGLLFVFILVLVAFALVLRETERSAGIPERRPECRTGQTTQSCPPIPPLPAPVPLSIKPPVTPGDTRVSIPDPPRPDQSTTGRHGTQGLASGTTKPQDDLSEGLRICQEIRASLLTEIQARLRAREVFNVTIDTPSGVLRLNDGALSFPSRSDSLPVTGPHQGVVKSVADVFAEMLPCFTASGNRGATCKPSEQPIIDAVFVEGHTDRLQFMVNGRDDNYGLSVRRALYVYESMKQHRKELWDLRNREQFAIMGMSGYGPERPIPGRTSLAKEDLDANRRIDFRFLLDPVPCSRLSASARGSGR